MSAGPRHDAPGRSRDGASGRPVAGLPPGVVLGGDRDLGGSVRSQVHRHEVLRGPAHRASTVVVKRFLPQPPGPVFRALLTSRWRWVVRECALELPDVAAACDEALTWAARAWSTGSSPDLPGSPARRQR